MGRKSILLPIVTLLLVTLAANDVQAEFSVTLLGTTNYVWRGYSKSQDKPAIQANIDYEHGSGVYLGASVSSVNFGDQGFTDRSNVEVTPYLGWSFPVTDDWRVDLQFQRYIYDGKIFHNNSDYNEFYGFIHFQDLFTSQFSVSPDYYGKGTAAADFGFTGRFPLTETINLSAGIGYSLTRDVLEYDYLYWNVGISWSHAYGALDLSYAQSSFFNQEPKLEDQSLVFEPEKLSATVIFAVSFGF